MGPHQPAVLTALAQKLPRGFVDTRTVSLLRLSPAHAGSPVCTDGHLLWGRVGVSKRKGSLFFREQLCIMPTNSEVFLLIDFGTKIYRDRLGRWGYTWISPGTKGIFCTEQLVRRCGKMGLREGQGGWDGRTLTKVGALHKS